MITTLTAAPDLLAALSGQDAPTTPVNASIGLSWIPYLAVGVALIVVSAVARARARSHRQIGRTEFLLTRGVFLLLIGVAALLLADAATEGDGLTAADRPVWAWLIDHRTAWVTAVAKVITEVGSTAVMAALALVAAGWLWIRQGRRRDALVVAVVTAGAGLLVAVFKPIVGRVRPPEEFRLVTETNQSFPSGHALASIAVLGVLAAVFLAPVSARWPRRAGYVVIGLFVVAIGASRLYLGVHWVTDIVGGWLVGAGWLLLCLTAWQWWVAHRGASSAPSTMVAGADSIGSVAPASPAGRTPALDPVDHERPRS